MSRVLTSSALSSIGVLAQFFSMASRLRGGGCGASKEAEADADYVGMSKADVGARLAQQAALDEERFMLPGQWPIRALDASSSYNTTCWSFKQVQGPPKVYPKYV